MAEQVQQGLPAGEIESGEDVLSEGCRAAEKLLEGYQRMIAELDAETAELQSVVERLIELWAQRLATLSQGSAIG